MQFLWLKPEEKSTLAPSRKLSKSQDEDESPLSTSPYGSSNGTESQSSSDDVPTTVVHNIPTSVRYRYSRRPFVHVVVLFAGDARGM
jgi:hypothetical protein